VNVASRTVQIESKGFYGDAAKDWLGAYFMG